MILGDNCSNVPKFTIWFSLLSLCQIIFRYENKTEKLRGKKNDSKYWLLYIGCPLSYWDCSESLSPPKDRLQDHHICRQ